MIKLYTTISRRKYIFLAGLSFGSFVLSWVILSSTIETAKIFLPSPITVFDDAVRLFRNESFIADILASIWRVSVGFLAAVLIAFPIGILAGTVKSVDAVVQPFNDFVRYMPVAAFIPLSILWVGIGDLQKMLIIFMGTVFQLIPLITDTASGMPKHLIELGYTMGGKPWQVLLRVVVPWCLPVCYDHSRVALGWAWSYLVVAELVAAESGIGHVIIQSQRFIQTGKVITGILVIGLIGLIFDQLFRLPKRVIFKWL